MNKRIEISEIEPAAYEAMFGLENYLNQGSLSENDKNLIKIRASQINGCAFCIDMHVNEALKNGEDARRIYLLNAWEKTPLFSKKEKLVLKMTEELTIIESTGLSSETYNEAIATFSENYVAQIVMAIATINAWNRISISMHKPPMGL